MKNKKTIIIAVIISLILIIYLIFLGLSKTSTVESTSIDEMDSDINIDDSDESITWSNYENREITLSESITITEEGVYNLTGTIEDGRITVNTTGNVKLVLNNVSITNKTGPAIYIEESESTTIYLEEGSTNYLEDGNTYSGYEEDVNGAIYSKDDLIFDGTGTLEVKSNYEDGIVCKDDLKFNNGTYIINSSDDAIRGKDSVYIIDGNYTITSSGDAIKSTNDTDSEKGYILIDNGTFNITSDLDGLQAETKVIINDGTYNIKTGGGSSNSSTSSGWGTWNNRYQTSTDTESAKGIKASNNIIIYGGTFNLDTSDDSIHSNNEVGINNGNFTISSGDDGIHADTQIIIEDGEINIKKSYEGIEASKITINGGNISITASDDGINVAGGADSSSMNRPGQNTYNSNVSNILTINNGKIYVNASGDGIDINGSGYIYNGEVTVDGPSDNGNGALDYDSEFVVNGGSVIAVGSSGMAQSFSSSSTQYNVLINFSSTYSSGKTITITDSSNNTIISYTPTKSFSSIAFSSANLTKNTTYTVKVDNTTYTTFTVSSTTTLVGSNTNGGGGVQGGAPGRR